MCPNKSRNEVLVKLSKDTNAVLIPRDDFIKEFVNRVLFKHFDFDAETSFAYVKWLQENYIDLNNPWSGDFPDVTWYTNQEGKRCKSEPDFMIHMRKAVRVFSNNQGDKAKIKRKLLQE